MARFREEMQESLIETIAKSCPICASDVKGNDTYLFFCTKCNILFKREELFLENPERLKDIVSKKISEKYEKDKDKIKIEEEPIKLKESRFIRHKAEAFVASKSSNVLHAMNCPFAKNIKKFNKEVFSSLEDAKKHKKYKRCNCIG